MELVDGSIIASSEPTSLQSSLADEVVRIRLTCEGPERKEFDRERMSCYGSVEVSIIRLTPSWRNHCRRAFLKIHTWCRVGEEYLIPKI